MSLVQTIDQTEYPESDGKPMGETDVHIDWMIRVRDILRYRYQGRQIYVGANLLIYYVEGDPSKFVVPDGFVVPDCDPRPRRTFKIWEEGKCPNVVFEITSRSSRRDDQVCKPEIYGRLGVQEYFLYDPTAEYLSPPLQGFRLQGVHYVPIGPDGSGSLHSNALGIFLRLAEADLVLVDEQTGQVLMTKEEAAQAAFNAAQGRVAQLEAELQRLRDELERRPGNTHGSEHG